MNVQRRRLEAETDSNTTLNSPSADVAQLTMNEGPSVNVHGLRYCFSIEPENADANANGFWVLYCLPAGILSTGDFPGTFADLDNEDFLPYVWGVGCWTASNQAPYHYEFTPSTSRNCQNGARILGMVVKSGISAGAVRINQTITCFTSN